MDPADPAAQPIPRPLAPGTQTACYLPWLKVEVALRYALRYPWTHEAWREVRQRIPWLLAEQAASARRVGLISEGDQS